MPDRFLLAGLSATDPLKTFSTRLAQRKTVLQDWHVHGATPVCLLPCFMVCLTKSILPTEAAHRLWKLAHTSAKAKRELAAFSAEDENAIASHASRVEHALEEFRAAATAMSLDDLPSSRKPARQLLTAQWKQAGTASRHRSVQKIKVRTT